MIYIGFGIVMGRKKNDTTLEKAFVEAAQVPEAQQDSIALRVLQEIDSERRWADLFERSQDTLADLGKQALAEHRAGKTTPMKLENL